MKKLQSVSEGQTRKPAGPRKSARIAELQRSDDKFRALFESAPDAMVIVGTDGRIALAVGR
ncbi:MAG: hypothetical protein WBQ86_03805 [Candidatus Binatus sp.]